MNVINKIFSVISILVFFFYCILLIKEMQQGMNVTEIMAIPLLIILALFCIFYFSIKILRNRIIDKDFLNVILIFQIFVSVFAILFYLYFSMTSTIKD